MSSSTSSAASSRLPLVPAHSDVVRDAVEVGDALRLRVAGGDGQTEGRRRARDLGEEADGGERDGAPIYGCCSHCTYFNYKNLDICSKSEAMQAGSITLKYVLDQNNVRIEYAAVRIQGRESKC